MLVFSPTKAGGGTWRAECVRCKAPVEVVGEKKGIATAAAFLDSLGWRRDYRRGKGRDACEWTCAPCKLEQIEGAITARYPSAGCGAKKA